MMKAIVNTSPNELQWRDWPLPQPGPGQVRIRTTACGICATDLEMIAGWDRTGFPAIPGHEWSGVVDAVGDKVNERLVGRCCVAENVWADGGEVGFEHHGGYAQYLITEAASVYPIPNDFPPATAALIEPLAVCVRGLSRLRLEDSGPVLIFGDGPIGLISLMLSKLRSVQYVALVGGRPSRLAMVEELGADVALNYHSCRDDLAGEIRSRTGRSFSNIIEATGSPHAMAAAFKLADQGGRILLLGDYRQHRADFPWNTILHRELELIGSNASAGAWPEAVELAVSKAVPLHRLISQCLPASSFTDAMTHVRQNRDVVKIILDWTAVPQEASSSTQFKEPRRMALM